MKKLGFAVVVGAVALAAAQAAAAATIVVTPLNMQGWGFFDDNGNGGLGALVTGPGTPPLGAGSAQLAVTSSDQGYALGTGAYDGTRLQDITNLSYWSYQTGPTLAVALQFGIHYTASATGWQGRLVFEPYQNGQVTVGSGWQQWSPLNGIWWATGSPGNTLCPISAPCSWANVLTYWPDASINGALLFKAGSGWSSFDGNVDGLTIGVSNSDTTYDFENGPTTKADCMNGGWQNLVDGNGNSFKTQGDCVSYVATGGKNGGNG